MSEQNEKRQRIYGLLNIETSLSLFVYRSIKQRKKLTVKELLKEKSWLVGWLSFMAYQPL